MVFRITERKKFSLIEVTFDFKLSADVFVFSFNALSSILHKIR